MNKKANTLLFILGGTVVNVILAILFIGLALYGVSLLVPYFGNSVGTIVPFAFVAGIVLAMFAYQRLTRWVIERFHLSDKMEPLFSNPRKRKPNLD
ncbi:leader peptide processing enzyme [Treponema zuelzerae]|uniref:Leader peptide processing enzyme n=1 Tax=Teretinema zuelzerae TaxID=156 RepID=A0AAE3JJ94_9SPIR|nr:leader peptide processing enzyme [Teretinema zuelzerae]MCD1656142.1 leader peptide processing enzyme [Teretinema zuelzerae]HPO03332.1 leader peptide processing enzyme [Treponemataceae bacterium]